MFNVKNYFKFSSINSNSDITIESASRNEVTYRQQPRSIFNSSFYNSLLSNSSKKNKNKFKNSETRYNLTRLFLSVPTLEHERPKSIKKKRNRLNCFEESNLLFGCCSLPLCLSAIFYSNKRHKRRRSQKYTDYEEPISFEETEYPSVHHKSYRRTCYFVTDSCAYSMDKSRDETPDTSPTHRISSPQLFSSPVDPKLIAEIASAASTSQPIVIQSPITFSSSSNSDAANESISDDISYHVLNRNRRLSAAELQLHSVASTSRTTTPRTYTKRRYTRKVTKEEEIKKENFRIFQEEMDKIEVVKEVPIEKDEPLPKVPIKSKVKKRATKKAAAIAKKPKTKPHPEPPQRINKRKQANPKKIVLPSE